MATLKIGKMILRSLFKKPATLMYPVVPRVWRDRTRGRIEINMEGCILCGICQRKCPSDALLVDRDAKTWTISRMCCIQCSCCVEVCPKHCLINKAGYTAPDSVKVIDVYMKPDGNPEKAMADGAASCGAQNA